MDENNLNSKPLDAEDNTVEGAEIQENEVETVETVETPETEDATENVEADDAEGEIEEAEYDEDVFTAAVEPEKKKKFSKGAVIAIVALCAIIIAAFVGIVTYVAKTIESQISFDQTATAVTVGDIDSTAAEFCQSYMTYYSYNSYYGYSEEELKELAIEDVIFMNVLYAEALENGYTVTDDIQAQIDEQMANITAAAESASMTADEYIDKSFGEGFTVDMYKKIAEKTFIVQKYYNDKIAEIEDKYKGDKGAAEIEAEYAADKYEYDLTDVSYWYFDASEENAQVDANTVVAHVKGGMSFEEAIRSVTGESEETPNMLKGHSKSALESGKFVSEAIEWIFAENEDGSYMNGTGAVTTVADSSKIYVFYVNNAPHRDETIPADVLYIQVDVSTDTAIKTEKELKIEAKAAAEEILKKFEETDKSVDSFTDLLIECNNGDDELVYGDRFEALKNDGSEDAAVEAWAFDASRQEGDYALVEGDGCYYILFFEKKAENAVWYDTILNTLVTNELRGFQEDLISKGKEIAVINEEIVNKAVEYITKQVSAQYGY